MGWTAERSDFESRLGQDYLLSMSSRPVLGSTQAPVQWVPRLKRPGREDHHSPPASVVVKKTWIYAPTSPYVFMA
jgi:hypothetical protein